MEHVKYIFYDLDSTLYPHSCGVPKAVAEQTGKFMRSVLNSEESEESRIKYAYHLYHKYGLTLVGLCKDGHAVNIDEYLQFVHSDDAVSLARPGIEKSPALRQMLLRNKQKGFKQYVFSNADRAHCRRIIHKLDIDGVFDEPLICMDSRPDYSPHDIDTITFKPCSSAYHFALECTGLINCNPAECLLIDDSVVNCDGAREAGWQTVVCDETNALSTALNTTVCEKKDLSNVTSETIVCEQKDLSNVTSKTAVCNNNTSSNEPVVCDNRKLSELKSCHYYGANNAKEYFQKPRRFQHPTIAVIIELESLLPKL